MNIEEVEYINCTGCAACYSICGVNAIVMQEDNVGFKYPKVIKDKCTDCNMCVKICPALMDNEHGNKKEIECYAMKGHDDVRFRSSSGGFFTYIAEYVLNKNGYVAGAAFDEKLHLSHILVNNINELEKLKKSKYMQSDINNIFRDIKEKLKNDSYVLFSGLPCQVAGLKSYLRKEYEKLITIDIVCHGVPSQKIFQKYIKEEFPNKKITHYDCRDKSNGWQPFIESIKDEKIETKREFQKSLYGKIFGEDIALRDCCVKCDYANLNRQGDITIGDFWGIEQVKDIENDNKGISLVLLNTEKGKNIFNAIKESFKEYKAVPLEYAVNGNLVLNKPSNTHINRYKFLEEINNDSLNNLYNRYANSNKNNIGIINFSFSTWNYGAVLTGYALQNYLKNQYKDKNIFNIHLYETNVRNENLLFNNFRKKYFNQVYVKLFDNNGKLFQNYIDKFETLIYGSDQVFRYNFIANEVSEYLGVISNNIIKLIAIAASFGDKDEITNNKKISKLYKNALKRFSKISVRENFGIDICNKLDINNVEHLLDPVFLLEKEDYIKLINQSVEKKDVFVYILDDDVKELDCGKINEFVRKLGYQTVKIVIAENEDTGIEDWIAYLYKSDMVITSSFHGAAFAMIFEKEFIFINGYEDRAGRIRSLTGSLNLENRIYREIEEVNIDYIKNNKINYYEVKKILQSLKEKTKNFIKDSINYTLTDEDIKKKQKYSKKLLQLYKKEYWKKYFEYETYKIKLLFYKRTSKKEKALEKFGNLKNNKRLFKNIVKRLKEMI